LKKAKVVAAIDFGTHGSGFAWSPISERNKIASARQVITELKWPGAPMPTPKNLTALATLSDGTVEAWGYDARKRWNAAAIRHSASDINYAHAFKMGLMSEDCAEGIVSTVAAYLAKLVEYATERIQASGYEADDIRWCLTVPAIWTDFQKQVMRKAAEAAGLPAEKDRLVLALEPEAAAHYARVSGLRTSGLSGGRASLMSPKSRFMVVDCGGGTIDITSYRADADNNLEEIGNDCGGPYGSDYLNRAFVAEVLLSRFSTWARMRELATESPAGFSSLVEGWEKEKTQVEFPVTGEIYIPIPAALHRTLTDSDLETLSELQDGVIDTIVVSEDETAAIFDRIVSKVLELVDKQLGEMQLQRRGARGEEIIVLVGGFGASKYLQARLKEHVVGRARVIIPPDPGAAVLEGAVHYAYDPQIIARKTKLTYGIASSREFRPGVDPSSKRFEDDRGRAMCEDYFSVFVNAQQIVRAGKCVSDFFVPVFGNQTKMNIAIHATRKLMPRYVDEDGVSELGKMVVDLSSVMHKRLEDRSVEVSMFFGETELRVQAAVKDTQESLEATLELAPQDWE
jgi:actin-like ATPase involved in cell morphogenesis